MGWLGPPRITTHLSVLFFVFFLVCVKICALCILSSCHLIHKGYLSTSFGYGLNLSLMTILSLDDAFFPRFFWNQCCFLSFFGSYGPEHTLSLLFFFFISFCCQCLLEVAYGWILLGLRIWESQSFSRGVHYKFICNNRCAWLPAIKNIIPEKESPCCFMCSLLLAL